MGTSDPHSQIKLATVSYFHILLFWYCYLSRVRTLYTYIFIFFISMHLCTILIPSLSLCTYSWHAGSHKFGHAGSNIHTHGTARYVTHIAEAEEICFLTPPARLSSISFCEHQHYPRNPWVAALLETTHTHRERGVIFAIVTLESIHGQTDLDSLQC